MKKWITGAVVAAGLMIFGGAAIAQDAAPQNGGQRPDVKQEETRPDGHEGCRFGEEVLNGNEV